MGYFDWEPQPPDLCEAIPADACSVNYCPETPCEYDNLPAGIKPNISIRLGKDGTTTLAGCIGTLDKFSGLKYPAIGVATLTTNQLYDGTSTRPVTVPLDISDQMIDPLVLDDSGVIKKFVPDSTVGKFKVVANNQSMSAVPFVYPSLAKANLPTDTDPDFFLAGNNVLKLCSEFGSDMIQLLKITPP